MTHDRLCQTVDMFDVVTFINMRSELMSDSAALEFSVDNQISIDMSHVTCHVICHMTDYILQITIETGAVRMGVTHAGK